MISTLACVNGHPPAAHEVAAWVGLRSRYQLNRILRSDGLPPLQQLAGWARVLYWTSRAEETGASLRQMARLDDIEPAVAYRLVRRVTGRRWSQLRRAGVELVISGLRHERQARASTSRAQPRPPLVRALPRLPASALGKGADHPVGALAARVAISEVGLFDVATTPAGLALLPRPRSAAIELIQLPLLKSIGAIRTGPNPTRLAVVRSGEFAYVTSQFGEEIGILDLKRGKQSGTIALDGCGHPLGAALAPDDRTLYVTTNADRLYAIALHRGRVTAWTQIPQASQQMAVHPDGHRVYAAGWREGILTECDARSLRIRRTFELGGSVQDVALTRNGRIFVANEAGWLDVIDGSGASTRRVHFGAAAFGVALSRDETVVLVSLLDAGRVALLDGVTLKIRAFVETGGRPRLMAADPTGRGVLVANEKGWLDLVT